MSPRQYLADFIPRASCWFSHDCPSIPKEVIPWVLAAEDAHSYFYTNIHEKYAPYETKSNEHQRADASYPVFLRRPQLHEIQQDIEDYSKVVIARVKTFTDSKYLIESILSELPDPLEFKRYIDNLIDDADTISEVSDSSYVSSYEPSEDDAELLEDF